MSEAPVEPRVGDRERHAADGHLRAAVGDGVGRARRAVAVMSETEVTGPLAPGQAAEG